MKKWIFVAPILLAGGFAKAAPANLNVLTSDPMLILETMAPETLDRNHKGDDKKEDGNVDKSKKIPQACIDANYTEDQKTKIKEAVYNNLRENVQLKADMKLAMLAYGKVVMDKASDIAAAQTAATDISAVATKIVNSHLSLGNDIIYNIATVDQREKTVECLAKIHKMGKGHHGHH